MKLYLDSCILIYLVDGPDPLSQAVAEAMRTASDALFCLSDLVRLECLVGPPRRGDQEKRAVFTVQFQQMTCLPLTPAVYDFAAELRAQHHFKTPDALHAAVAVLHGCDEFWTNDLRLKALGPRLILRVIPESAP